MLMEHSPYDVLYIEEIQYIFSKCILFGYIRLHKPVFRTGREPDFLKSPLSAQADEAS